MQPLDSQSSREKCDPIQRHIPISLLLEVPPGLWYRGGRLAEYELFTCGEAILSQTSKYSLFNSNNTSLCYYILQ